MIEKAQQDVLGCIIAKPRLYFANHQVLKSGIFSGNHYDIFSYISIELSSGGRVDSFKLTDKFGADTINPILTSVCTNFEEALGYLIEKRNERIVADTAMRIINLSPDEAVKEMEECLFSIKDLSADSHIANLSEQTASFLEKVSKIGEGITGLRTDFYHYDSFTSGVQPGELIFVAGETSQGKTSFALTMVSNIVSNNHSALVLSLEMSVDQLIARLVSQRTGISSKRILSRNIDRNQLESVRDAVKEINRSKLYLHDCTGSDVGYIIDTIRKYKIVRNVDVVMIDYLQLIANHEKYLSKEQQVGTVARKLKNLSKELNIPILCLSQLSRNQADPKPKLSRLRDSGQIEEAADQVIFVYRPETYNIHEFDDGSSTEGKADVIIAKGRNVGTAVFRMDFVSHLTLFRDESERYIPNIVPDL